MSLAAYKTPGIHDESVLRQVYAILVKHSGARMDQHDENSFVECALNWDYRFTFEYRFMGSLGGGGKIWLPLDGAPYVNCYRENETPERGAMMEATNGALSKLMKSEL